VGMQIIHHQTDVLGMGILLIPKLFHKICPVNFCALLRYFCLALPVERFTSHTNICGPISLIFCVIFACVSRLHRPWLAHFTKALRRHLIHTHLRILRIIRDVIDV
jgi:hypothetical protein